MKKLVLSVLLSLSGLCVFHLSASVKYNTHGHSTDHGDLYEINLSWGRSDVRYPYDLIPDCKNEQYEIYAWKGEHVSMQALVWANSEYKAISIKASDLIGDNTSDKIKASCISTGIVKYIMTDELNPDGRGCGPRPDHSLYDSSLVADCIDIYQKKFDLKKDTVQPIWIMLDVPKKTSPGKYRGEIQIETKDGIHDSIEIIVNVSQNQLPDYKDWAFHLDLWQNPFAVARYHEVELWSKKHFKIMTPIMSRLAKAGQKVITASIMHHPWNGQTYDPFESMVEWVKTENGEWKFDFSVFDKWVKFMMNLGIDEQINCYSMIPWNFAFRYYDAKTKEYKILEMKPEDVEYKEIWSLFLINFAKHLEDKGWFEKCVISMDERPLRVMQKAISIINEAVPDFKISLAGHYHEEIEEDIYDYSIPIGEKYPNKVIESRKAKDKITTLYTSCSEGRPNTFTFSHPYEAAWICCCAANRNMDGYLRWAYNSWPENPMTDSRFRTWAAGDTYLVYPGNCPSVRFENLIYGIQIYEKINIQRRLGTLSDKAEDLVSSFEIDKLNSEIDSKELLDLLSQTLN